MATVYAVYKNGQCVGRCDSKCHEASNPVCNCCCGGGHHGIGSAAAKEDRKFVTDPEIIETSKQLYGDGNYRVARMSEQMEMFI